MIAHAGSTIVVAHGAKFGRRAAFCVCRPDEIDVLVCDARLDSAFLGALAAANVKLL